LYDKQGDKMNREKTKQMVTGALMAAVFGVLSVINVYTGTMFDILFIYLMTVALAYYTFRFNEKMAFLVWLTSTVVLFMTGELFFTLYSFFTLPLGILYIYCQRHDVKQTKWVLRGYSAFKNFIILFLLGSLLGLNTFQDTKEIFEMENGRKQHTKGLEENENSEKQKVANFKKQYQQRNEAYEKTIEDTIQMYHEKEQQER